MKTVPVLLLAAVATALAAEPEFPLTADSKPRDGVPKGEVLKFTFEKSKIFPGTFRDYAIYVPKQYDPAKPACLMVFQDGNGKNYEAPTVFDNLIERKELPVIIGVFVMHGRVKVANPDVALDRFNRSYEYDGSSSMNCCPMPRRRRPPMAARFAFPRRRPIAGSAVRRAAVSRRSPRRGNGPIHSAASSRRSVRMWACAVVMGIPRSSANSSRSRSACFCRTVRTISTSTPAIGGW
jgi:hypothetical protein